MQEKVYFKTTNNINLCGVLSNPTEDGNVDVPIVILCHGFATDKGGFTITALEKFLTGSGIATFKFDFFGHGESEGKFEDVTITQEKEDILEAVRFLSTLGYEKMALYGASSGGGAAIMAAEKLSDLFALVLKAPAVDHLELEVLDRKNEGIEKWKKDGFVDYERGSGQKFKLNYTFFEDLENNIGYEVAREILAPTLIVHGDNDEDVPVSQSIRLSQEIADCDLEILEGADHKFSDPEQFREMVKIISDFIIKKADQYI